MSLTRFADLLHKGDVIVTTYEEREQWQKADLSLLYFITRAHFFRENKKKNLFADFALARKCTNIIALAVLSAHYQWHNYDVNEYAHHEGKVKRARKTKSDENGIGAPECLHINHQNTEKLE